MPRRRSSARCTPLPIVCCGVEPTKYIHRPSSPDLMTYSFACTGEPQRQTFAAHASQAGGRVQHAGGREQNVKGAPPGGYLDRNSFEPLRHFRQAARVNLQVGGAGT